MSDKFYTMSEVLNRVERRVDDGDSTLAVSLGGTSLKITHSQTLYLGEFDYTTDLNSDFYFNGITFSCTDGNGIPISISEVITLSTVETNSNFNTILLNDSFLNGAYPSSSFAFFPEPSFKIFASTGSQLKIKISNLNLTGVVNMTLNLSVG